MSSLSCFVDELISWTMEKTEESSANSLAVDERLWLKSFMYIRKKIDPKIDPWGTPALVLVTKKIPDHSKELVDIYHLKNSQ